MAYSVLHALREGNNRFISSIRSGSPILVPVEGFRKYQKFQSPQAALLVCADSRVSPELLFGQGIGELFVVRSAGNIPDTFALASLEFAAAELKVQTIIVLGHTSCGAVNAAVEHHRTSSRAATPALDLLVKEIQRSSLVRNPPGHYHEGGCTNEASRLNAQAGAALLVERSLLLRERVRGGQLSIHSGLYSLETGRVDFFDSSGDDPIDATSKGAAG